MVISSNSRPTHYAQSKIVSLLVRWAAARLKQACDYRNTLNEICD